MMCITGLRVCLECLENTSTSTKIKLKGGRTQRNATQTSDYLPPQEAIYTYIEANRSAMKPIYQIKK